MVYIFQENYVSNRRSGCMFCFPNEIAHLFVINSALMPFKVKYSQLSVRRTPLGPVLCVRLREKSVL